MKRLFVVIASYISHDGCEDELYTSQWCVGTFNSIQEGLNAAERDLHKVAKDHYECVLCKDEYDTEDDFNEALKNHIDEYLSEVWKRDLINIEASLDQAGSAESLSNDFCCDVTDQRQLIKYYIYNLLVV